MPSSSVRDRHVQRHLCTCVLTYATRNGTTHHTCHLSYDGEISSRLPWNASQAELQSALSSLSTLTTKSDYGNITFSVNTSRPQFCHSTLDSNTTFTFRSPYGNLYVMHQ